MPKVLQILSGQELHPWNTADWTNTMNTHISESGAQYDQFTSGVNQTLAKHTPLSIVTVPSVACHAICEGHGCGTCKTEGNRAAYDCRNAITCPAGTFCYRLDGGGRGDVYRCGYFQHN